MLAQELNPCFVFVKQKQYKLSINELNLLIKNFCPFVANTNASSMKRDGLVVMTSSVKRDMRNMPCVLGGLGRAEFSV